MCPGVRLKIQYCWIFLERTPVLSNEVSRVTSFIEVFPCFPPVVAATDQRDNTRLHILDIIMSKNCKTGAIRSVVLSTVKMEQRFEMVREEPCLYDVTLAGHSDQQLINNIVLEKLPSTHNDVGRNPSSGYKFVRPGHPICRTHGMSIAYDCRIHLADPFIRLTHGMTAF